MKLIIQSILFIFGLADNPIPKREEKTDAEWLASDWIAVGNDIRKAMSEYEKQ